MKPTTDLYFEAHITVEPFDNKMLPNALLIAKEHKFRAATFLLKKSDSVPPDDFLSTRDKDYDDIMSRTINCVIDLKNNGFNVKRYKIENTLLDVKLNGET